MSSSSTSASPSCVLLNRREREMNTNNPYLSSPPLLLDTRIQPIAQQSRVDADLHRAFLRSDRPPSSFSASALTCNSHNISIDNLGAEKSTSNAPFHNDSSFNSLSSICSSSSIRRKRQRNSTRTMMKHHGSHASLTSCHTAETSRSYCFNNSNGNRCSIGSNVSSVTTSPRRSMRRQKSRSFESLRNHSNHHDGLQSSRDNVSTRPTTTGLRKSRTFESIATLRKRTSSGCFSQASASSSSAQSATCCNSSGTNFSWSSKGVIQMAQRSNGAVVKGVIDDLQRIVDEAKLLALQKLSLEDAVDEDPADSRARVIGIQQDKSEDEEAFMYEVAPLQCLDDTEERKTKDEEHEKSTAIPLLQCSMLAQWTRVDTYYKVVITKYHGIPIVIGAMNAFAASEEVQASCCITLANLTNKVQIFQEGGAQATLRAMKEHPESISVQSAALETLLGIIPLIQHLQDDNAEMLREIQTLVKRTDDIFLTEEGKKAAMTIKKMVGN